MKARVLQLRKPDPSAPRPYDSAPVPALSAAPSTSAGVSWSLFEGNWPWMPDFRALTGVRSGVSNTIDLSMPHGDSPFGVTFETFFNAPADGVYNFKSDVDGSAMLFIHDIRVIDEPKVPKGGVLEGSVRLQAGWHPLRLLYRKTSATPSLKFSVSDGNGGALRLDESNLRQSPVPK